MDLSYLTTKELEEKRDRLLQSTARKDLPEHVLAYLREDLETVNQTLQERIVPVDEGLAALRAGHAAYMRDYNRRTGRTQSNKRGRPRKA